MCHRSLRLILYTTKNCARCKTLKAFLLDFGVDFIEKSLDDIDVMAELVMKNITILSAPVIEINGMVFEFRGEN